MKLRSISSDFFGMKKGKINQKIKVQTESYKKNILEILGCGMKKWNSMNK